MHQNRTSPFASDFHCRLGNRREFCNGNQFCPFESQRKGSDLLRRRTTVMSEGPVAHVRRLANGVVRKWGVDGFNRILTRFYFFSPVGVRLAPLKTHDFKSFPPDFNRIPWSLVKIWLKTELLDPLLGQPPLPGADMSRPCCMGQSCPGCGCQTPLQGTHPSTRLCSPNIKSIHMNSKTMYTRYRYCKFYYHGIGNFYLINFENVKIGIGIGKSSVTNSAELQIRKAFGKDVLRGIRIGIGKRN